MSFSGLKRKPAPVYSSLLVFMIIFFVLQILSLSSDCCRVTAARTPPPPPPPRPPPPPSAKDSDDIKRSELYKRFFNGRFDRVNSIPQDKSFRDIKRTVPSCPDPLHN
ncbi:hypothetical protein L1987_16212 [Smallanthus sonchifolius]|uniref:Uncharacterized protein n=1 Tax=Smallanthus sonchifolius TaxID=185202 RepID=A0ACB9J8Q3_9ASTR|nr:hypothetical protein L1987_16212 [Smallanthus sonchifolius]